MTIVLRRVCMLSLAAVCCLGMALQRAEAALDTQVLATTRGLLDIPEGWLRGEARTIVLNGARLRVATGHSPESLRALLDRAERECRVRSAGLHTRARKVSDQLKRALPALADGILRVESEREGLVACLDLGTSEASMEELAQRLSDFAREGDLQRLGGVRMLRAQARTEGAFFVATWNEGRAPLWQMFPATGDAPGLDFATISRPRGSRRVLSSWQEQGAPAINVYESADAADVVWARYTRELAAAGWHEGTASQVTKARERALLLMRGAQQLVITAASARARTFVSVMLLDAGPGAVVVR